MNIRANKLLLLGASLATLLLLLLAACATGAPPPPPSSVRIVAVTDAASEEPAAAAEAPADEPALAAAEDDAASADLIDGVDQPPTSDASAAELDERAYVERQVRRILSRFDATAPAELYLEVFVEEVTQYIRFYQGHHRELFERAFERKHKYWPTITAIFLGATLTATSVGITARVLQDLRLMHSVEARIVIGAAVIDDIMGIVLLGLVSALVAGQAVSVLSVGRSVVVAVGFLVMAVGIGLVVAPKVFGVLEQLRVRGMLLVAGFAFLLFMSAAADRVGLAMIIGAFAAGLVLSGTNQFDVISDQVKPVADIFTPVFFLSIGAKFDVRLLDPTNPQNVPILLVGGALFAIAVVGKLAAGWAAPWIAFNRPGVGIGMIPRGEVGLIFANMGLVAGVVTTELFSAVLIMLMGTTFIAPPLLKWSFGRWGVTDATGVHAVPAAVEVLRADAPPGSEE